MLNKLINSRGFTVILIICILTCLWFVGKSYLWRSQPTEPEATDKPPTSLSPSTVGNRDSSITSKKDTPGPPPKRRNIKLPRRDEPEPPAIPEDKLDRINQIVSDTQEQRLRGELTPQEADELLTKKKVEILTEGMDALGAAKYLKSLLHYSEYVEKYAKQAVDEDPNSFEALLLWADYQDPTERERAYRKLVDMDPTSVDAWMGLGHSLWYNHPEEAVEHLQKANSLDPNAGLDILGDAYQRLGEYDKALETYKKAFEVAPIPPTLGAIKALETGGYTISPIFLEEEALETETEGMPTQDAVVPLPPAEEPVTPETQGTLENDHQETAPIQETVPLTQQEIDDFLQQLETSGQSFEQFLKALDKSDALAPTLPNLPTEKRIETFLRERFSPERLNRASETLNRYGPEEGLRRLEKDDPEIAKQIGRLIDRKPPQQENNSPPE